MAAKVKRALFWLAGSLAVGILAGLGGLVLVLGAYGAQKLVSVQPLLTWALPLTGLACVELYRLLRVRWDSSTNDVIVCARDGHEVPGGLAPAIVVGTCLSILGGGSVGKEGAAVQMGGAVGSAVGRGLCRLRGRLSPGRADEDQEAQAWEQAEASLFIRMGMAAAFGALFYAPVAALLFVCETTRCHVRPSSLVPIALCAFMGAGIARLFPDGLLWHSFVPHALALNRLGGTLLIGVACGLMAIVFCWCLAPLRAFRPGAAGRRPWAWALVAGVAVVVIAHLLGIQGFFGTGDNLMQAAYEGTAQPLDFLCKAVLTLLVLGMGFKGGEIMPIMAIGATLGCVVGPLAGAEAGPSAALGTICLFAACANCPLAAIALGLEAFGPAMGWTIALGVAVSCVVSAPVGFYDTNRLGSYRALGERLRSFVRHCWALVVGASAR